MAGRLKVDTINPGIIRELADKFPEEAERARKKYKKFDKWLRGEAFPTYNQLVELSKIFNVPFGDFFLEKLPEIEFPMPHYRTFEEGSCEDD
jgi:transcriptional regulator with XRE-family HTH domain